MFLVSVLAFILGIYWQAIHAFPVVPVLFLLVGFLVLIPFLINRTEVGVTFLIVLGFFLAGSMRLNLAQMSMAPVSVEETPDLYKGRITESSPPIKTVRLSYPEHYAGLRAAFASDAVLPINTEVHLLGYLRELNPSFKNPSIPSWKWLKRLEGIGYELKGRVVSLSPGTSLVEGARQYLKKNIERSGARHGDVLSTLTVGDRTSLDQEKNHLFVRTGTSHVLAISGFNVGIISGFFFFIIRFLFGLRPTFRLSGRHTRYAALLTMPFPFIFMFIAGTGVSVIRATIMILVYMLALFFEKTRHAISTMALSALIILLFYPHSLFAPSFQLTFMSLIFIMVFLDNWYPVIGRIKGRAVRWTVSAVCSTGAATLGTAPIVIYHFYGINPFTVLHNLVAVPLIGVAATSLSLVGMLHSALAPVLWAAGWIVEVNVRVLKALDFGYIWPIVRPNLPEMFVYYALLLPLFCIRKKRAVALLLVSVPALLLTGVLTVADRFHSDLRISFLDVGGGDSILIEAPRGMRILVDGGGFHGGGYDVGERVLTPFLLAKKIRTLDYVAATHPHGDHIGGLASVFRNFKVKCFVAGNLFPEHSAFRQLREAAVQSGAAINRWRRGDVYRLADDLNALVLSPRGDKPIEEVNNGSLVLALTHGPHSFLFTGDIKEETEEDLILSGLPLKTDVMKVAHHGSRFSSTNPFLLAAQPKMAIITCDPGAAKGLPSPEALARFEALKIPVLRTDRHGMIEVRSDGRRLTYCAYDGTAGVLW